MVGTSNLGSWHGHWNDANQLLGVFGRSCSKVSIWSEASTSPHHGAFHPVLGGRSAWEQRDSVVAGIGPGEEERLDDLGTAVWW